MDGTLLDLHFDNYFWLQHLPKAYALKNQISEAQATAYLMPLFKAHQSTLNWYCVDFWSDLLEVDIMALKAEIAYKISYRPKAQAFLAHCQEQVDDLRLITNGHRKVLNLKIKHTQLSDYFVDLHCSHELGAPKEDQLFWEKLQSIKPFDSKRTLFIDDSEVVLSSAQRHGIKYIFSISKPDSQNHNKKSSCYPQIETFQVK